LQIIFKFFEINACENFPAQKIPHGEIWPPVNVGKTPFFAVKIRFFAEKTRFFAPQNSPEASF